MRNEGINVRTLQPVAFQKFLKEFGLLADCKLEDLLPVLMHVVHSLRNRLFARRIQAPSAGHVEILPTGSIYFVNEVDESDGVIFRRLQNRGTCAVPENHAGGATSVVDNRPHHTRANY